MSASVPAKPNEISTREVYQAWLKVKANRGQGGVDGVSLEQYEIRLAKNLYRLWNRMSSGSYFPHAVRRVEIAKRDGKTRPLGIPTINDRVAQEVVRARLEPEIERKFVADSYGFRPGKSALDAVAVCRKRNWELAWVLDVDIEKFFDTLDHELLMKAVQKHCREQWCALYIQRWLKAPILHQDGKEERSTQGTPQGGVISPLLANLYLHYAFDKWMERENPQLRYIRYADDIVVHCQTKQEAETLKDALTERLRECHLKLHPEKTEIVYCRDSFRRTKHPHNAFTFLGYTFQPRKAMSRRGKLFTSFLPAASKRAKVALRSKLKAMRLRQKTQYRLADIAALINPVVRGWLNYFVSYGRSTLRMLLLDIDRRILTWVKNKFKVRVKEAVCWMKRWKAHQPSLFTHWKFSQSADSRRAG